jgi:hypothetical protein
VTSPVGSPPLKILAGLTWPNPWPWAKSPVSWPSVGTAAGLDGGVVGPVVGPVAGTVVGPVVGPVVGDVAVTGVPPAFAVAAALDAVCVLPEHPAIAMPIAAIATAARVAA